MRLLPLAPDKVGRLVSLALLVASLALIVHFVRVNFQDFSAIGRLSVSDVTVLVALQATFLGLQVERTRLLLEKASAKRLAWWKWFRIFVIGRLLNLFVPQAAIPYRGSVLRRRFGIRYAEFATAFFSLLWITTVLSLALATLVIAIAAPSAVIGRFPFLPLLATFTALVAGAPFLASAMAPRLAASSGFREQLERLAGALTASTSRYLSDTRFIWRMLVLTLLTIGNQVLLLGAGLKALGLTPSLFDLVLFYALQQAGAIITITPGNLGVQELAFGAAGEALGMSMADGILLSAVVRAASYVVLFPLAVGSIIANSARLDGNVT